MKCQFCGKSRDEMDTASKMCTICGWSIEEKKPESTEKE